MQPFEPHWTQVLAALLTPTIAVFGSLIAYRQWRTAQNKLKLDLFERRLAIYNAARVLIASVMTTGKAKDEEMQKFLAGTRGAKWLLNDSISKYIDDEIWPKAVDLQTLEMMLDGVPVGDERTKNVQRQGEIRKWFLVQYEVLDNMFSPFLRLKH